MTATTKTYVLSPDAEPSYARHDRWASGIWSGLVSCPSPWHRHLAVAASNVAFGGYCYAFRASRASLARYAVRPSRLRF